MFPLSSSAHGPWLVLYLLTWVLHFVFVGYVLVGSAYALVQALRGIEHDPIAERARDVLPFMLGCGITAGVAPLLFLQLLYQERFYTANLLLGPRWGAVVPALVAGFYALYLAKAATSKRWRTRALAGAVLCFLFVAWSWTELHLLMRDEAAWVEMYAAGERFYRGGGVGPRLLLWLGVMTTLFAIVAAWWAPARSRVRLAGLGLAGRLASGVALAWFLARGESPDPAAHAWRALVGGAIVIELGGWVALLRRPAGAALLVITGAGTAAMLGTAVIREAALESSGAWVFVLTALVGIAAITWIVRTIRAS